MKLTIEGTAEEIKKALQAIASSEERGEAEEMARDTLPGFRYLKKISGIADIPSGDINNPIAEPIQCNLSKVELDEEIKKALQAIVSSEERVKNINFYGPEKPVDINEGDLYFKI